MNRWTPQPQGTFKCNSDAFWSTDSLVCGMRWILRDYNGQVKWVGAKTYPKLTSPLEAEATAMTSAVTCLSNMDITQVTYESDSQILIEALWYPEKWPSLKTFTSDVIPVRNYAPISTPGSYGVDELDLDSTKQ